MVSRNHWNITGFGTPEKSHSVYPCEVAGGSSLAEPCYDSLLVVAMRFRTASRWWPGRSSYAATSVLANEVYAATALHVSLGNYNSTAARSPTGAVVTPVGASPHVVARTARRRSTRAWRERWLECRRRRGAEAPAASA
jgi:hypothetical protein